MKRLGVALMVIGGALLVGGTVTTADYPPGQVATLVATPPQGGPGYTVNALIQHCFPGELIHVVLGVSSFDATCDATTFEASGILTAPVALGSHDVTAFLEPHDVQAGGLFGFAAPPERPRTLVAQIEVVQQVPPTDAPTTTQVPSGTVPATGSGGIGGKVQTGALLLVAGLGILAVSRTRRPQPA